MNRAWAQAILLLAFLGSCCVSLNGQPPTCKTMSTDTARLQAKAVKLEVATCAEAAGNATRTVFTVRDAATNTVLLKEVASEGFNVDLTVARSKTSSDLILATEQDPTANRGAIGDQCLVIAAGSTVRCAALPNFGKEAKSHLNTNENTDSATSGMAVNHGALEWSSIVYNSSDAQCCPTGGTLHMALGVRDGGVVVTRIWRTKD